MIDTFHVNQANLKYARKVKQLIQPYGIGKA